MKKLRKKRIPPSINKLFPILIFIVTVFMSVGYASINSIIMNIDGEIVAKAQDGIYITEIEYVERDNSLQNENYSVSYADNTLLKSSINLEPNDLTSEVSLKVSFYNSTEYDYIFKDIVYAEELTDEIDDVYSNPDIVYTFTNQNEIITKNGGTLDVIITFKYSSIDESTSNILNSILNFKFDLPVHIVATYDYTGDYETFIVPYNGVYQIELWGAQGGGFTDFEGGKGGYVSGELNIEKDTELYIYVGGSGAGVTEQHQHILGGYNGGGDAMSELTSETGTVSTGGGATDIRLVNGDWNNFDSLKSRIMVAGGGGGSDYYLDKYSGYGGSGGGLTGYDGTNFVDSDTEEGSIGTGGTQKNGGYSLTYVELNDLNGGFGYGGSYVQNNGSNSGTGGSGYYGGGSGHRYRAGGGGGSSFISGHNGCDAISESSTENNIVHTSQSIHYTGYQFSNTIMIDGNGYNWLTEIGDYMGMPTYDGTSIMTGNIGNGYAKITYLRSE